MNINTRDGSDDFPRGLESHQLPSLRRLHMFGPTYTGGGGVQMDPFTSPDCPPER